MIGKLSGRVDYVAEDHALIETAGVGYIVYCSSRTLSTLRPGEAVALYTELEVREDALTLYGFTTLAEREWRRLLTSVQGVGSRVALGILGALGPEAVGRALALGDVTAIRRAPGVGPKLATRIVNELKDKAPAVMALRSASARPLAAPAPQPGGAPPAAAPSPEAPLPEEGRAEAEADALSALVNLGYGEGEAAAAVAEASQAAEDAPQAGALIRAALQSLARKD